jgi:hypothetical protein
VPALQSAALRTAQRLIDAGHTTYFAGGCVRDALLGIAPKDYDLATSATPDEVMALFPRSNAIGAHFGVILVKEGKFPFEIATFRHDGSYKDGRHPESVTFSTPEEDANDVTSPLTDSSKIPKPEKSSTSSVARPTLKHRHFVPSEMPAIGSKKTHCA